MSERELAFGEPREHLVEVPHLARLQEVIGAIRRVKGVTRVDRRQRLIRLSTPPPPLEGGGPGE